MARPRPGTRARAAESSPTAALETIIETLIERVRPVIVEKLTPVMGSLMARWLREAPDGDLATLRRLLDTEVQRRQKRRK